MTNSHEDIRGDPPVAAAGVSVPGAGGIMLVGVLLTIAAVALVGYALASLVVGHLHAFLWILFGAVLMWVAMFTVLPLLALRLFGVPRGEFDFNDRSPRTLGWRVLSVLFLVTFNILAPLAPVFVRTPLYRCFGLRAGAGTVVGGLVADPWLVSMGSNVAAGHGSVITGHEIIAKGTTMFVRLREVVIGNNVTLGGYAFVMSGVRIGDNSVIAAGTIVPSGTEIPAGEVWAGQPAKFVRKVKAVESGQVVA